MRSSWCSAGFASTARARQTIQALRDAGVKLPSRRRRGDAVEWVEPTYERVRSILSNPAMGGAYAYGRQRTERIVDDDDQVRRIIRRVAREDWQVLLEEHHEGYVSLAGLARGPRSAASERVRVGDGHGDSGRKGAVAGLRGVRPLRALHACRIWQGMELCVRVEER